MTDLGLKNTIEKLIGHDHSVSLFAMLDRCGYEITRKPFRVLVKRIRAVLPHPNADRLDVNDLGDASVISNRTDDGVSRYKVGQLVIHVPVEAIVPEWLMKESGYWDHDKGHGFLGGPNHDTVEPRKMRGLLSEGLIIPVAELDDDRGFGTIVDADGNSWLVDEDHDVSKILGIARAETS